MTLVDINRIFVSCRCAFLVNQRSAPGIKMNKLDNLNFTFTFTWPCMHASAGGGDPPSRHCGRTVQTHPDAVLPYAVRRIAVRRTPCAVRKVCRTPYCRTPYCRVPYAVHCAVRVVWRTSQNHNNPTRFIRYSNYPFRMLQNIVLLKVVYVLQSR